MLQRKVCVFVISLYLLLSWGAETNASRINQWIRLEPGLEFGEFLAVQRADSGDSLIRVLRIEPRYFRLRLLNASAVTGHHALTAKEWSQRYNLVAAINASMYQKDYLTSISLMQTEEHINNPRLSKDKTILAFDRQSTNVPEVKIIDRQCENFDEWKKYYTTFVQNIRMISCKGRNVWRQQPDKKWSMAVIAVDTSDRILFIHVRSRYTTHDLINNLLQLPLQISRAIYAEGGSEAQLYINSYDAEYEFIGSYRNNNFASHSARRIPNVIGIVRRIQE